MEAHEPPAMVSMSLIQGPVLQGVYFQALKFENTSLKLHEIKLLSISFQYMKTGNYNHCLVNKEYCRKKINKTHQTG